MGARMKIERAEHAAQMRTNPLAWRDWARGSIQYDSGPRLLDGAIIQRWAGSAAEMRQPPLDHHYVSFHQGGAKRVQRRGGRQSRLVDVPLHACTTVEAGSAYHWSTEGPIAFAHIYIQPDRYARTIAETFDRDPAGIEFEERIGMVEPLTSQLVQTLVDKATEGDSGKMAGDYYLDTLLVRLFENAGRRLRDRHRLVLTPHTLRKVRDFILARLNTRITLDELAEIAGYSRFHFARAFREATGLPPYAYLINERIGFARQLLAETELPIDEVARASGFATHAQFTTKFKQLTGMTPSRYRDLATSRSFQKP